MKKKKISKASKAFYIALSYLSPRLNTEVIIFEKIRTFPGSEGSKDIK